MRALITRRSEQASHNVERLQQMGVDARALPLIAVTPLQFELPEIQPQDCVVFNSSKAVKIVAERLNQPFNAFIAVQGPKTQAEVRIHLKKEAHCFTGQVSDSMAHWLCREFADARRFILFRAKQGRTVLRDTLLAAGCEVVDIHTYDTELRSLSEESTKQIREDHKELLVCFFSPSAVYAWVSNKLPAPVAVASFGPVTTCSIKKQGWQPAIEGRSNKVEDFLLQIKEWLEKSNTLQRSGKIQE